MVDPSPVGTLVVLNLGVGTFRDSNENSALDAGPEALRRSGFLDSISRRPVQITRNFVRKFVKTPQFRRLIPRCWTRPN